MGRSSRIRARAAESRRQGPQSEAEKPVPKTEAEKMRNGAEQLIAKDQLLKDAVDQWQKSTNALYVTGTNDIGLVDWDDPDQKELGDAIADAATTVSDRLKELGYEVNDGLISQMPFWGGGNSELPQEGVIEV